MTRYRQFCPVAKAAEIFAERWTPLILRELLCGSHRFAEIQRGIPQISQSLLTARLRSLEHERVIERRPARDGRGWEYHLTPAGVEFGQIVELLGGWGYRWVMDQVRPDDLDAGALMLFLHRHIRVERLPRRRVVVRFEFRDDPRRAWWMILSPDAVDLCVRDEGFEVDVWITADVSSVARVYLGEVDLREAVRQGRIQVEGPPDLAVALPDWIGPSHFTRFGRPDQIDHLLPPGISWPAARREALAEMVER